MASIDITARVLGDTELAQTLARLSAHDVPKAIRAGVRYAASGARTELAKGIRTRYGITSGRVKQDVTQPQYLAGGQTAIINTSRKPITAMQFKPREVPTGLSLSIYRGERFVVKSGFMQHSTIGTFAGTLPFKPNTGRRYRGDKGRPKPRAGMDTVKGPSIHAIYTGGKYASAMQQQVGDRIEQQLEKGILRALGAMGRGFGRA